MQPTVATTVTSRTTIKSKIGSPERIAMIVATRLAPLNSNAFNTWQADFGPRPRAQFKHPHDRKPQRCCATLSKHKLISPMKTKQLAHGQRSEQEQCAGAERGDRQKHKQVNNPVRNVRGRSKRPRCLLSIHTQMPVMSSEATRIKYTTGCALPDMIARAIANKEPRLKTSVAIATSRPESTRLALSQ